MPFLPEFSNNRSLKNFLFSATLLATNLSLTLTAAANTQLFSDSFENAASEVWSASEFNFTQLTSTSNFSHSGAYSAHNASGERAVAVQEFDSVDSGTLRVTWWVLNKGAESFDLASFYLGQNGPGLELTGNNPTDLVAVPTGGYEPGLASLENDIWYELSIIHNFDESMTRFYFQGNEVYEFAAQVDSLSNFSLRTDDANLYIDDVEVIHQVIEDVPSNVDLAMDAFSDGTTEGWTFDHPQLVAVDTYSHQGGFSVHKPEGASGTHGLEREFDAQSIGLIETSWWVLAIGSDIADAALFSLGDALTFSLQDGGSKLSLSAVDSTIQYFQPEIRTLPNGRWFKLGINYNFETNTASFLLDGNVIHEAKIDVQAFTSLTLTSDDSTVYIDEIVINNSDPVAAELEAPSLAVETEISEIGIDLVSRVENAQVVASWTEVPTSDGYRLYFSSTEFSDVANIDFIDFGSTTSVDAFLPYGSTFHIAIGAYKDGENIALSNREIVDIPALEPKLTTNVIAGGMLQASWEEIPNAENYRLYYHTSEFTSTEGIAFADMGELTELEVNLFQGADYYVALAIKAKDNPESALSSLERVSYFPEVNYPIFPPPPSIDRSRIVGCCNIRSDVPYVDEFGFQWGYQLLPLPRIPPAPTLKPLGIFSGDPGETVIAANSLTSSPPFNDDTTTYFPQNHDSVFSWGTFSRVMDYQKFSRAFVKKQLSFGISIDFDEKEYGNRISLTVALGNDVGDVYYLSQNGSWYKAGSVNYIPRFASGIASEGTHQILGLPYPPEMFGEMQIAFFYEVRGLVQDESRTVITDGFNMTLQPAFQKLDSDGNRLPDNASTWACVHDTLHGLVWEAKTHDGGLRDAKHTYSWFSSNSSLNIPGPYNDANNNNTLRGMVENGGDCVDSSNCDTEKYINQVNASGLCGANDWRMPTINELQNLARGFSFRAPWYQEDYLDDAAEFYWSGSNAPDSGYGRDWAYYALLTNVSACSNTGVGFCTTLMNSKNKIYAVRKAQ